MTLMSRACWIASLALPIAGLPPRANAQGPMTRVSVNSAGVEADDYSYFSALSGDGRYVAFDSAATNLIANDGNGVADLFVRELATGIVVRVSVDSSGSEVDGDSYWPAISDDGRFVAFTSFATNLVASDTNFQFDVFVHDRDPDGNGLFDEGNGVTTRASVDSAGVESTLGAGYPNPVSLSGDGRLVAFWSASPDLVANDTNRTADIFVHDLVTGATTRASVDSSGNEANDSSHWPALSGDGKFIVFASSATNLVAIDKNGFSDVFRHDLATGNTRRVNLDSGGTPARGGSSGAPALSGDGRFVLFVSGADNLVAGDTNHAFDAFVRDTWAGTTTRISVDSAGAELPLGGWPFAISGDGRFALFGSASALSPDDGNGRTDLGIVDLAGSASELVTATCLGTSANDFSDESSLSDDGALVSFRSDATDFVDLDTNGVGDIFVFDRALGWPQAYANSYGAGFAGTLGVPTLTATAPPAFGAALSIDASNSAGAATVALMVIGVQQASIPTSAGGTLLVLPLLFQLEPLPAAGLSLPFTVPLDPAWCGVVIDLQALELDAGALHGIAFTAGLELAFGQ